jgi:sulfur-carrier protein
MATVWIPAQLRTLSGGQDRVDVVGSTVGEVIDALDCLYPGMKARLCDENGLRRGIAVAVDSLQPRLGLLEVVEPASEVHFIPAIAGGAD